MSFVQVPLHVVVVVAVQLAACAIVVATGCAAARRRPFALVGALGGLVLAVPQTIDLIQDIALRRGHRDPFANYFGRHENVFTALDWCYGVGLLLIAVGFAAAVAGAQRTHLVREPVDTF